MGFFSIEKSAKADVHFLLILAPLMALNRVQIYSKLMNMGYIGRIHQIVVFLLQFCSENNLIFVYNTYNKNILTTVKAVLGPFYRHRTNHKKRIRGEYKMQNYFTCREVSTSSSESSNLLHNRLLI